MPTDTDHSDMQLPLAARAAIAYLLVPVLLFLLGWFKWWFALPVCALTILALTSTLRGQWRVIPRGNGLLILLVAAAWVMLSGAGGYFDTNTNADWIKNDAILLDMLRGPWPTHLPVEGDRAEPMLRYYLGYYMVPATIGKIFGASAMSWALALWTMLGVALSFSLLNNSNINKRWLLLGLLVFMFFSGADILRALLLQDLASISPGKTHLEWAYPGGLHVQYSSNMTGLMYVPQHFLPAALMVLLLMDWGRHPTFIRISGVLAVCCLFWSPFVALGLLPFLGLFAYQTIGAQRWRELLSWPNLVLCGPLLLVLVAYLTSGPTQFKAAWIWEKHATTDLFIWLPVFFVSQFLLLSAALLYLDQKLWRQPWFALANICLLLLPWYSFGFFNDLAMRASLPALLVLCVICVRAIWQYRGARQRLPALFVVLCLGAVTGLFEVARVVRLDDGQWRSYEALNYTTLTTVHRFFRAQYKGTDQPQWLQTIMKDTQQATP